MNKAVAIDILKDLLQREYLQRDLYETYSYYLFGLESPAIHDHLKEHLAQEQTHIEVLQRYLMGLGEEPFLSRTPIPRIDPLSLKAILDLDLELEKEAVEKYSEALATLEPYTHFKSIVVALEDILKDEQEHVHDLIQWLEKWRDDA